MDRKKALGLCHIGIYVSDLEVSEAFYEKLGFVREEQFDRPNGTRIGFMRAGSCVLELIVPVNKELLGRSAGVVDHICFDTDDIDGFMVQLKADGIVAADAKVNEMDMFGHSKNLFFAGPDGERLELFQIV